MQHVLKYKNERNIRPSEAAMSFCDAREKLKTAACAYATRKLEPTKVKDAKPVLQTVDMVNFTDESAEGKALEEAARVYVWWRDFCEHLRKKPRKLRGSRLRGEPSKGVSDG